MNEKEWDKLLNIRTSGQDDFRTGMFYNDGNRGKCGKADLQIRI